MARRINVILSDEVVRVMDRVTKPGQRSRFIAEAIHHYVAKTGRATLRRRLKEGAIKRADRDLALASEWFSLEEEAWPKNRTRRARAS